MTNVRGSQNDALLLDWVGVLRVVSLNRTQHSGNQQVAIATQALNLLTRMRTRRCSLSGHTWLQRQSHPICDWA